MSNEARPRDELPSFRLIRLRCRRTGQMMAPEEHESCPYCFGREGEVERGVHERFCDYRPEKDPIGFGMPPWSTRTRSG